MITSLRGARFVLDIAAARETRLSGADNATVGIRNKVNRFANIAHKIELILCSGFRQQD